jgi:Putative lumazine-binding
MLQAEVQRVRAILAIALIIFFLPARAGAQTEDDKTAVLATVQKFFDTMAARDVEEARTVLLPEARTFSVREQNGQPSARASSVDDYLASLAKGKSASRERMWNPEVRIKGPVATVWTPYDFHIDGKFSHCGIDAFTLVKTSEGWKIASGTWTVERTGCAPSPLGPLK